MTLPQSVQHPTDNDEQFSRVAAGDPRPGAAPSRPAAANPAAHEPDPALQLTNPSCRLLHRPTDDVRGHRQIDARYRRHVSAFQGSGLQTVPVLSNLDRLAATGDQRAELTLRRAPRVVDERFLAGIGDDGALDLARYGIRHTTVALRRRSIDMLTDALLATALGAAASEPAGRRDLMVGLALPHVVAREIGVDPAVLFTTIADRVPDSPVAQALIEFGSRQDVDLTSFGWALVETPDGPDFVPE